MFYSFCQSVVPIISPEPYYGKKNDNDSIHRNNNTRR